MPTFRLNIVFSGVDFDDDEVFEALANLPHILWRAQGGQAFATSIVTAASAIKAADIVIQQVMTYVPSASPVRLDDDLVAIPDIASRVGVTREAVRNWANGTRQANFPSPKGIVGDGIKIWAWSDVNGWLRENLSLGDPETFPTAHDTALVNALFSDSLRRLPHAVLAAATWSAVESVKVSAVETRTSRTSPRETDRRQSERHQVRLADYRKLNAAA
jgi:hypothetical protein